VPSLVIQCRMTPVTMVAVGGFLAFLAIWFLICVCGHLPAMALVLTVPGAVIAWVGWVRSGALAGLPHLLVGGTVIFSSMVFLLNFHNLLWSGHDPLLR